MASQRLDLPIFGSVFVIMAFWAGAASAGELFDAAKTRDLDRALALLDNGANPDDRSPYDGALHVAARLGPPELVTALLDAGANIELQGYGGSRPLHSAALAGQKKIVSILLERGAKVDSLDNIGRTPLLTFVSGEGADVGTLKVLLAAGADPNLMDATAHLYALHYAAMLGRVDETILLVTAGADVNARDKLYGKTPLHYATGCTSQHGGQEVVEFLIEHGADVNAKDNAGMTPLDHAKQNAPNNGLLHQILGAAGAR